MKMTEAGYELIRNAEGFRMNTYADATGVLTIGYGHTSMAGPPRVSRDLHVTAAQAEAILRNDVASFEAIVRNAVKVGLTDAQYSALVSFCFNVGGDSFARSSVLTAVNQKDFAAVPRRLALWTKAGGRTLPGLIRRRADEAALFMGDNPASAKPDEQNTGKPALRSRSVLAAIIIAVLDIIHQMIGDSAPIFGVMIMLAILVLSGWLIRERLIKSKLEGI